MREIKFRAWNKKLGRFMTDGDPQPIIHPDGYIDFGQYRFYVDGLEYTENDIEINLWTGLYDRNGKEIYEGDIFTRGRKFYYVVVFHKGSFRLKLVKGGFEDMLPLSRVAEYGEVIGNIYENPELLEETPK